MKLLTMRYFDYFKKPVHDFLERDTDLEFFRSNTGLVPFNPIILREGRNLQGQYLPNKAAHTKTK